MIFLFLMMLTIQSSAEAKVTSPKSLTASFSILADVIQNIAPTDIKVDSLIGFDQDPHDFELRPQDILRIKKSDALFLLGYGFDHAIEKGISQSQTKAKIYYVTKNLNLMKVGTSQQKDDLFDPHFWQSPQETLTLIQNLKGLLLTLYPESASIIEKRAQDYSAKLSSMQTKYLKEFASLPKPSRQMIVSHNSFQYLAREFDISVDSPLGVSEEGETSIAQISRLVKRVKSENIKALFVEKSAPDTVMKTVSRETKTPIAGILYSDALSRDEKASTYLKLLEYNLQSILKTMK